MSRNLPHSHSPSEPAWVHQANQPVTYPRMFVEIAESLGVSGDRVLARAGLEGDVLDDPAGRLSLAASSRILESALALTGDATLGFQAGLRLPLTAHGSLGYALMCADTARQATQILKRFWHLRGRGVLLMVTEEGFDLMLELVPELPISVNLREPLFSSTLTSMFRGLQLVSPSLAVHQELWLQGEPPPGFETWRPYLPPVRFGMPRAGLLIHSDKAWLDEPLPTANPEGLTQAISQCERESALMDSDGDVLQRTRTALTPGPSGYPSPEQVAAQLCLSPRTLRRRLQEQGYNYKQLLEEARQRDSRQLLVMPELGIHRIAELLGYSEPANFTRAFKAWNNLTPSQWRRRQGNPAGP
ncbi:MAG: AraC family transcriptional regulator [Pseudomonadales bacterium]|nr:AraC family transcriptional regulator [Pseudomonadales bacterium]